MSSTYHISITDENLNVTTINIHSYTTLNEIWKAYNLRKGYYSAFMLNDIQVSTMDYNRSCSDLNIYETTKITSIAI